jgi:hypothetical protein
MTDTSRREPTTRPAPAANGAVLAAFLAAGIGAFAMGLVVLLNEAGLFTAPSVHAGAGGVSGRTTLAAAAWLAAWAMLHRLWGQGNVHPGRVYALTLLLIGLGVLATFPPVWQLF